MPVRGAPGMNEPASGRTADGPAMRPGGIPLVVRVRLRVKRAFQRVKNDLLFALALAGVFLCRSIPHRWGMRAGERLGRAGYALLPRERARALDHLSMAFGPEKSAEERRRIARSCFGNMGKIAVETINLSRLRLGRDFRVLLEGRRYLDEALGEGRGVIWLTAHLGNWELIGWYMARLGYPVNVVARALYDERLNRLLLRSREDAAVRVFLRESPSTGRQILQALKRGEILGMLIDQDTKVKGVMADFFGRPANTPAGPAILAVRRGAPVVAGFIHRVSDEEHRIVIHPPLDIQRTGDTERDVAVNTERFNRVIEREIRKHPEQWVWVHRRWRRRVAYDPDLEWKVHLNL